MSEKEKKIVVGEPTKEQTQKANLVVQSWSLLLDGICSNMISQGIDPFTIIQGYLKNLKTDRDNFLKHEGGYDAH